MGSSGGSEDVAAASPAGDADITTGLQIVPPPAISSEINFRWPRPLVVKRRTTGSCRKIVASVVANRRPAGAIHCITTIPSNSF